MHLPHRLTPIRLSARIAALTSAVLAAFAAPSARADVWLFDFGDPQTFLDEFDPNMDPVNEWNNVGSVATTDEGELFDLLNTDGDITDLSLAMLSRFNGTNGNGIKGDGPFPPNATGDSNFGNTELFGGLENITPRFRIAGLNPALVYNFSFYASRMDVGDNRETLYTVEGITTASAALDVANNIENIAEVPGISPTASGDVTISLAPSENNNNGNHFTYLGVLRIESVIPGGSDPVVITSHPDPVTTTVGQPVTFLASATGSVPFEIQWLRDGEPIDGANGLTYSFPATLALSGGQYSVRIKNAVSNVVSNTALLTVTDDTTPPTVAAVSALNRSSVLLEFSERIDPESAALLTNYTLGGGAVVSAVQQSPDGRTVTLTIEPGLSGTVEISFGGLLDLAGNALAAGTTASVSGPSGDPELVLIDFGGDGTTTNWGIEPADPVNAWNNVTNAIGTADSSGIEDLVFANGASSGIALGIVSRFNATNTNGTLDSSVFPASATQDTLYGNTEDWNSLTDIYPVFELAGLDPAKTYTLSFYGSRVGAGEDRSTVYTIAGSGAAVVAEFNPGENIDDLLDVPNLSPTAAGVLTVSLTPGDTNNTSAHFTYLGVLTIKVGEGGGTVDPTPPSDLAVAVVSGNVARVTWTGEGALESTSDPATGWTAVTPAPSSPYEEPLAPGERKFYRLRY